MYNINIQYIYIHNYIYNMISLSACYFAKTLPMKWISILFIHTASGIIESTALGIREHLSGLLQSTSGHCLGAHPPRRRLQFSETCRIAKHGSIARRQTTRGFYIFSHLERSRNSAPCTPSPETLAPQWHFHCLDSCPGAESHGITMMLLKMGEASKVPAGWHFKANRRYAFLIQSHHWMIEIFQ